MALSLSNHDVHLARGGDAQAIDRVMRAVTPSIQAILRRFPLSPEDRVDALQNTLLRVYLSLASYREEARFSTWLYRVCANEALMLMRKVRTRHAREIDLDLEALGHLFSYSPDEPDEERHELLREALAALPTHYQSALAAYYGEERGLEDIAASSDETESAVRARVHRARQLLRRKIGEVSPSDWSSLPQHAA